MGSKTAVAFNKVADYLNMLADGCGGLHGSYLGHSLSRAVGSDMGTQLILEVRVNRPAVSCTLLPYPLANILRPGGGDVQCCSFLPLALRNW